MTARTARDALVFALHDADCPDLACDPMVMGNYYRQADDMAERAAARIYPDVMNTWEDHWPHWEYADEQVAEFMRNLARAALAAALSKRGQS